MYKKVSFFALLFAASIIVSTVAITSVEQNDRALGTENTTRETLLLEEDQYASHYLARYFNQDGFNVAKSETADMVIPGGFDHSSNVEWKASYGRYSETNKYIRLGVYNSADNVIALNSKISDSTDPDFIDINNDLGEKIGTYNIGMVSTKYFTNIQDISIYWSDLPENSQSGNKIRIIYKTDDSDTWKILLRDDGEGGVGYDNYMVNIKGGTGVSGDWNAYAAHAGNYKGDAKPSDTGDFALNLQGKNAKIGFVYTVNYPSVSWYLDVTAICINRAEAIKGYINFLDGFTWTCSAIEDGANLYNMVFNVMGYKFLQHHADALNVECSLTNGRETTYYDQFTYLYSVATNGQLSYSPLRAINVFFGDNKFGLVIFIICFTSLLSFGAFLTIKKVKNHLS